MYIKKSLLLLLAVTLSGSCCFADSLYNNEYSRASLSAELSQLQKQADSSKGSEHFALMMKLADLYASQGDTYNAMGHWMPVFLHGSSADIAAAQNIIAKKLEANPNDEFYNTLFGVTYKLKGLNEDALTCFNKVLSINPNYMLAETSCARLYQSINQPEKAIEIYTSILNKSPREVAVRAFRAQCYSDMGMNEKAKSEYVNAIQIEPNDLTAIIALYKLLEKTTPPSEMLVEIFPKYKTKPINADSYIELAKKLSDGSERKGAIKNYKLAISLDPNNLNSYIEIAKLHKEYGENELAQEILMTAKPIFKDNIGSIDKLNSYLAQLSDDPVADAKKMIDPSIKDDALSYYKVIEPKTAQVYMALSDIALEAGHTNDAMYYLTCGLKTNPKNSELLYKLALVQFKVEDLVMAKDTINKALIYSPKNEEYLALLAKIQPAFNDAVLYIAFNAIEEGNNKKAADILNNLFREGQKNSKVYYCRGLLRFNMGNRDAALEDLIIANQMDKSDPVISRLIAIILEPNNPKLAIKYYQECITNSKDPESEDAKNSRASIDELNKIILVKNSDSGSNNKNIFNAKNVINKNPGQHPNNMRPPLRPGQHPNNMRPPLRPGQHPNNMRPPLRPGQHPNNMRPPLKPGQQPNNMRPPSKPGQQPNNMRPPSNPNQQPKLKQVPLQKNNKDL